MPESRSPLAATLTRRYDALANGQETLSCGQTVFHADPQPGEVCLDLGCGQGKELLVMAGTCLPGGIAYGLDLSQAMLERLQHNAQVAGLDNVVPLPGFFHNIDLADESVDLVVSNCALNHAPDKPAVWREIGRILKPGGRVVVSDIYSLAPIPQQLASDPELVAQCWAGAQTRDDWLASAAGAGLERLEILNESKPYQRGGVDIASFTVRGWKKDTGDQTNGIPD